MLKNVVLSASSHCGGSLLNLMVLIRSGTGDSFLSVWAPCAWRESCTLVLMIKWIFMKQLVHFYKILSTFGITHRENSDAWLWHDRIASHVQQSCCSKNTSSLTHAYELITWTICRMHTAYEPTASHIIYVKTKWHAGARHKSTTAKNEGVRSYVYTIFSKMAGRKNM